MGLNIVRLKSSNTIHLLADGLTFKIVSVNEGVTDTISESDSKHIITTLNNGVEVEKILQRIRQGEELDTIDRTITISMTGSKKYSSTNFMIWTIIINGVNKTTWTGNILRDEGVIYLTTGVIKDILDYLTNIGIQPKARPYYIIKRVAALPITSRTDIAWMLTEDFDDKPAGTMWRWDGEKWVPVEDDDEHFTPDPVGGDSDGGNFIISVEQPENLEPGTIWGRIDP